MKTKNTLILISVLLILSALGFLLYKDDVFKKLEGDNDIQITTIPSLGNSFFNLNIEDGNTSNTLLVPDLDSVGITKGGDYSDALKECASKNNSRSGYPEGTCVALSNEEILINVEKKGDTFSNFIKNYIKNTAGPNVVGSPDGFYAAFQGSGGAWNKVLITDLGPDPNNTGKATICNNTFEGVTNTAYNKKSGTCVGFKPANPKNFITNLKPGSDEDLAAECKKSINTSLNYKETITPNNSYFEVSDVSTPKRCSVESPQIIDVGTQSVNQWVRTNELDPSSQVPPYHVMDEDRVIEIGNILQTSDFPTLLQNSGGGACIGFTSNATIPWLSGKTGTIHESEGDCYKDFPCEYLSRIRNTSKDRVCNVNGCQNEDTELTDAQKSINWKSPAAQDNTQWVSAKKGCFRHLPDEWGGSGKCLSAQNIFYPKKCTSKNKDFTKVNEEMSAAKLSTKCRNTGTWKCESPLVDNVAVNNKETKFEAPHYYCKSKGASQCKPCVKHYVDNTSWYCEDCNYLEFGTTTDLPNSQNKKGQIHYRMEELNKNSEKLLKYNCGPSHIPDQIPKP